MAIVVVPKHQTIGLRTYECFLQETAEKINEEAQARGEVHLSWIIIDGIVFPTILETGQIITGIRTAAVHSSCDSPTILEIEALVYRLKSENKGVQNGS